MENQTNATGSVDPLFADQTDKVDPENPEKLTFEYWNEKIEELLDKYDGSDNYGFDYTKFINSWPENLQEVIGEDNFHSLIIGVMFGAECQEDPNRPAITTLNVVPEKYRSYRVCKYAAKRHPGNIRFIPEKYKDFSVCFLSYHPDTKLKDHYPKEFLELISKPDYVKHLPEEFNNPKTIHEIVKRNPGQIAFVDPEMVTYQMCCSLFEGYGRDVTLIKFVPDMLKKKIFELVASKGLIRAQDIPKEYLPTTQKSWERIVLGRFNKNLHNFSMVPTEFMSERLSSLVIKEWKSITQIPEKFLTKELCEKYLECHPDDIGLVPMEFREDMKEVLAKVQKVNFNKVTWDKSVNFDELTEDEIYEYCLRGEDLAWTHFERLEEKYRTRSLCERMIKINPYHVKDVPKDVMDEDLAKLAVSTRGQTLPFLDLKFRTPEVCTLAIENGASLRDVPKEYHNLEMCQKAIKSNIFNMDKIPDEHKTALYQFAVKEARFPYPHGLQDVPVEYLTEEGFVARLEEAMRSDCFKNASVLVTWPQEIVEKKLTDHLVMRIFESSSQTYYKFLMRKLPEKFKTEELCKYLYEVMEPGWYAIWCFFAGVNNSGDVLTDFIPDEINKKLRLTY